MKKLVFFLAGFVLLSSAAVAQQITGAVKDGQGKGIEKVTVSLLMGKDSSVIKLAVTAVSGKYSFAAPGQPVSGQNTTDMIINTMQAYMNGTSTYPLVAIL